MDFDLDDTQASILGALRVLFARGAGAARARELASGREYDAPLEASLAENGFLTMFADEDAGPLAAVLAVEEAARSLAGASVGTLTLVAPALGLTGLQGPLAITRRDVDVVRFGVEGAALLVVADDTVRLHRSAAFEPIDSIWGHLFGRLVDAGDGEVVGPSETARAWWQVALAAEVVGAADAAFAVALDHLMGREQFGRPLASLQALQHKMAIATVRIEGARWLARRAATVDSVLVESCLAASAAEEAARWCVRELQQVCGALGLSEEFDLHLWTTRLHALAVEIDGLAPARAAADLAWP